MTFKKILSLFCSKKETEVTSSFKQLLFPNDLWERVGVIAARTNVSKNVQVVTDAMRTYDVITERLEEGTIFWAQLPNGEFVLVEFIRDCRSAPYTGPVLVDNNT